MNKLKTAPFDVKLSIAFVLVVFVLGLIEYPTLFAGVGTSVMLFFAFKRIVEWFIDND